MLYSICWCGQDQSYSITFLESPCDCDQGDRPWLVQLKINVVRICYYLSALPFSVHLTVKPCVPGFQAVQPTGQMRQARPTGAQQGMRAAMNARPITGQQPNGAPGTRMGVPGAGMPRGAGGTMQGMPPGAQPRASFKFTPAMRNPPPQQVPQQQSIQQVMIALSSLRRGLRHFDLFSPKLHQSWTNNIA